MTPLLIATTNPGKVRELRELLSGLPYHLLTLADLPETPPDVEETGTTFAENALLKARYYHQATGLLAVADDSGLMVNALQGRPGVYSARYAGVGATSAALIAKLLTELAAVPAAERQAQFVCVLALCGADEETVFHGTCAGTIAVAPRGAAGFGYDPIFIEPGTGKTFGELSAAEKHAISHRGNALRALRSYLAKKRV